MCSLDFLWHHWLSMVLCIHREHIAPGCFWKWVEADGGGEMFWWENLNVHKLPKRFLRQCILIYCSAIAWWFGFFQQNNVPYNEGNIVLQWSENHSMNLRCLHGLQIPLISSHLNICGMGCENKWRPSAANKLVLVRVLVAFTNHWVRNVLKVKGRPKKL